MVNMIHYSIPWFIMYLLCYNHILQLCFFLWDTIFPIYIQDHIDIDCNGQLIFLAYCRSITFFAEVLFLLIMSFDF